MWSHSSSASHAARLLKRPYFVQLHTHSSGLSVGAYPGKSSTTTSPCSANQAFTAFDWLWILLRSQTTVNGPRSCRRSWSRNTTTSSPCTVAFTGSNSKYSPGLPSRGLSVMQLIAEIRSRRSQQSRIGVWPRGARLRRTVGVRKKPDSSRKTTWARRRYASRRMRGSSSPNHLSTSLSSRSRALRLGFWLVQPRRCLRILRTCSGWKETPKRSRMRRATRSAVHNWLGQPCFLAPCKRRRSSLRRW